MGPLRGASILQAPTLDKLCDSSAAAIDGPCAMVPGLRHGTLMHDEA